MTDEDGTRSLVHLEEALDGDLELASSLVGRDVRPRSQTVIAHYGSAGHASVVQLMCE